MTAKRYLILGRISLYETVIVTRFPLRKANAEARARELQRRHQGIRYELVEVEIEIDERNSAAVERSIDLPRQVPARSKRERKRSRDEGRH